MTARVGTPADAAAVADHHADAIKRQITLWTSPPPRTAWDPDVRFRVATCRKLIDRSVAAAQMFGADDVRDTVAARMGAMTADEFRVLQEWPRDAVLNLQFAAQDAGVLKMWERYRIAYSIDPDLWAELAEAEDDTLVPEGVLPKLPHPDPFIALPEPIVIPTFDKDRIGVELFQRIEGFFVTGRFGVEGGGYLATSTRKAAGALSLLFCSRIVRANGSHYRNPEGMPDYSWTRISVDEGMTVGQMVAAAGRSFTMAASTLDWQTEVVLALRQAVAVLLYLCTTNADLTPMPRPPARRKGKGGKGPLVHRTQVVTAGYRLGAALRAYYRQEQTASGGPTGRKVRPHVRRAHFHTYRVGPGRTAERKSTVLKWVSAVPVNFTTAAETTTVHPLTKRK